QGHEVDDGARAAHVRGSPHSKARSGRHDDAATHHGDVESDASRGSGDDRADAAWRTNAADDNAIANQREETVHRQARVEAGETVERHDEGRADEGDENAGSEHVWLEKAVRQQLAGSRWQRTPISLGVHPVFTL